MTSAVAYTAENYAMLDYQLVLGDATSLSGKEQFVSSKHEIAVDYFSRCQIPDKDGVLRHKWDSEAQACEWLAIRVYRHYRNKQRFYEAGAKNAKGYIKLFSDLGPCRSCRSVIKALKKDFPQVAITVYYKGDKTMPTEKAGQYGYEDAVQEKPGVNVWKKVV